MDGRHLAPLTRRAGFWVRAVAWGVDFCADAIALVAVTAAVDVLDPTLTGPQWLNTRLPAIVVSLLMIAYSSFEVFAGATPGKMILGLKIATARGTPADRWTLALRWSAKQAPLLLALVHALTLDVLSHFLAGLMNTVVVVGCLQALDEHKRAWHDEWARTAVFHRPRGVPASADVPAGPPPLPA